jgi:HEAT repeat protein
MRLWLLLLALIPAFALAQPNDIWKPYVQQGDANARITHIKTLGGNPTVENLRLVVAAVTDSDLAVHSAAMEVLRHNKSITTFNLIVEGMPNGNQFHVGHLLASDYREPKYVQRMVKLLKHKDEGIRRPMAMAMGIIKEAKAFLPLVQMARDPNALAREIARNALVGYKEPRYKASLQKLAKHADERIRNMAAEVLRAQG